MNPISSKTKKGEAKQNKIDVFKKKLWYVYKSKDPGIFELSLKQVLQIIEDNKNGKSPPSLEELTEEKNIKKVDFKNVVGQDNINRFDKKNKKKKSKNNNFKKHNRNNKKSTTKNNEK